MKTCQIASIDIAIFETVWNRLSFIGYNNSPPRVLIFKTKFVALSAQDQFARECLNQKFSMAIAPSHGKFDTNPVSK